MEKSSKVLLSAYDSKDKLINHFAIIYIGSKKGEHLLSEMYASFHNYVQSSDMKRSFILCKYMFINPDKKEIEYTEWAGYIGVTPKSGKHQTEVFFYKPDNGVQYKTII